MSAPETASILAPARTGRPAPPPVPWSARALAALTTWLPLVLMALLALGTWWLVKNTPVPEGEPVAAPLRHEPDYVMNDFQVQRFDPRGALQAQITGSVLRHYPDTQTLEIDDARLRSVDPQGRVTVATARSAQADDQGTEVELRGGVRVVREATATEARMEFRGEVLHAFLDSERLRSREPVTLDTKGAVLRADSLHYDHAAQVLVLEGNVRATFTR